MQTIQIGNRKFVVVDDKARFYACVLGKTIEGNAKFAQSPLAKAMIATLEVGQQTLGIDVEIDAAANGGAAAAVYFNPDRFIAPPSVAGRLEGIVLNGTLLTDTGTRGYMDEAQIEAFGQIDRQQIAEFVKASRETTVRCNDGRLYDVTTLGYELARNGSKDAQTLLALFGLQNPTEGAVMGVVQHTWREGGVRNAAQTKGQMATGPATKGGAATARRSLGIEVPAHLLDAAAQATQAGARA